MKHTDRHAIGLELFFASRSGTFSGLRDYSAADIERLTDNTPAYARYPIAKDMHSSLEALLALDFAPAEHIPQEVVRLVTEGSAVQCCHCTSISIFFRWLLDISRRNEQDRVERIAGLNTVASCFSDPTASFIRTGLTLNNQRVFISRNGDNISVSYAERDWGRVYIDFSGCILPENSPPLPLPGYAFSTEAEILPDGRYKFHFLIDTCFAGNDYCERLMQPEGWHEFSFTCQSVSTRLICCDYAGRLDRIGTPRAELIDRVCSILLSKQTILGDGALSFKESAMLPVARLIIGSGGLLSEPRSNRWQSEQLILDSLDNRYAMQQFSQLLKDSKCTQLLEYFDRSSKARFDDNEHNAIADAHRFASFYEQQLADGSARSLILSLADRFCEMTREFEGSTLRSEAELKAVNTVRTAVHDQMTSLKFEGSFPHYQRRKRRRAEYLSFMLLPAAEHSRHGIFSFYVSLAAAKISRSRLDRISRHGISPERTNALDCQPELSSVCRYGELASADDGEYVRIDTDLFTTVKRGKLSDETGQLQRYIRLANRQFRFGNIPCRYAFSRLRKGTLPSPSPRLFLASLPVSAILSLLSVIVWHILTGYFPLPVLTVPQALACAAGACLIINSILTVLRRIFIAGKLWRYR